MMNRTFFSLLLVMMMLGGVVRPIDAAATADQQPPPATQDFSTVDEATTAAKERSRASQFGPSPVTIEDYAGPTVPMHRSANKSDSEGEASMETKLFILLLTGLFWAVIVGFAAKQQNRNLWGWAIAGALSWPIALLFLAFLPSVCPKCGENLTRKQDEDNICPTCGSFATTSRTPGIWLRIRQGGFAAAQKFRAASFTIRAAIVFSVFWILCVGAYVFLFETYGKYMSDAEYLHMIKIMLFPPVIVFVGLLLYKKAVAMPAVDRNKNET